jgi:hypothetical protein
MSKDSRLISKKVKRESRVILKHVRERFLTKYNNAV